MTTPSPGSGSPRTRPLDRRAAGPSASTRAQSLADGAVGAALLHIELAVQERQSWNTAHTLLRACTRDIVIDDHACLYLGAPAVAFVLHTAAAGTGRYARALNALDAPITSLTRRRIAAAHARIDRGQRPRVSEYDLFHGLTGLGVYLHTRHRDNDDLGESLRGVLTYLVRLTHPLPDDDRQLCGWWTDHPPGGVRTHPPGGHANLGMAHGIAGPLTLLAITARDGIQVPGHTEAITRICRWLDDHREDAPTGPRWPRWVTLHDLDPGRDPAPDEAAPRDATTVPAPAHRTGTPRPSWCYGTPGIAAAQHLAALPLNCPTRRATSERAVLGAVSDTEQLDQLDGPGLCHGTAGLLRLAQRIATDPRTDPATATALTAPRARLGERLSTGPSGPAGEFLDGDIGARLVRLAADNDGVPATGWDASLLLG